METEGTDSPSRLELYVCLYLNTTFTQIEFNDQSSSETIYMEKC